MNSNILKESQAKHGELVDMVSPLISVDEYEPKAGNDAQVITIAIYTYAEKAAEDIRKFIERGTSELLDAEVSPNPDEDNYWPVFIEFKRTPEFWQKLLNIVDELERLVGNEMDWEVSTYFAKDVMDLRDPELNDYIILSPADYIIKKYKKKKKKVSEKIGDFLDESLLKSYYFDNDDRLTLSGYRSSISFQPYNFGNYDDVVKDELRETIDIEYIPTDVRKLKELLGESYYVNNTKHKIFVQKKTDNRILILNRYG